MSVDLIRNFKKTTLEAGVIVRLMYNTPPIREDLDRIAVGVVKIIAQSPYFTVLGSTLNGSVQRLAVDLAVVGVPTDAGRQDLDFMLSSLKLVSTRLGGFGIIKGEFIRRSDATDVSRLQSMGVGTVSSFEGETRNSQPGDFLNPLDRIVGSLDKSAATVGGVVGTAATGVFGFFTSPKFVLFLLVVVGIAAFTGSKVFKGRIEV